MDDTATWVKLIGGGAVAALLFWVLNMMLTGKLRRGGEFDESEKRHAELLADKDAQIKYWQESSQKFELRAYEGKAKVEDARAVARQAVNAVEKTGQ